MVAAAIFVMLIEDVFDAIIQSGFTASETSLALLREIPVSTPRNADLVVGSYRVRLS